MKTYISIPITGHDLEEVKAKLIRVKEQYLKAKYGDIWREHLDEVITPIEINEKNWCVIAKRYQRKRTVYRINERVKKFRSNLKAKKR